MTGNRTNTLLLTVIGVATLLVAVIGATFAYFTANVIGGEDATTITVGAGKLSIAYDSNKFLEADEIQPEENIPAMTKEFTITGQNSTEAVMPYGLEFIIQENTFTENALSYTLESTNEGGNGAVATPIPATGIPTGAQTIDLTGGYFSGVVADSLHKYVLKVYFQETFENQDEDKGKTFKAFVNVAVKEVYTSSTQ